ncbi:small GTP-binding protein [Scopulibacillus darangshiensis]|uniref:Small GTP-binding protein n=1 Tax=Scopulibacillus darangshiensis TaxID=442528 RepID=A0A4R2NZ80_9BACL|nr:dynamin family protein [Scopulibacillus darangshiensis]TCP27048.1 small GTP-binding protein [Scopulibacillus darangshiensis]
MQLIDQDISKRGNMTKRLANLYATMKKNGDLYHANKLRDLYKKNQSGRLSISFCGHFSAGKSSLLNRLIEEAVLPSSPIPTSGNLVRLMHGEPKAKVYTSDGQTVLFPAPYDIDDIQTFCKDTAGVTAIDIHVGERLPESVELIDTPGVDSTDDAHQRATADALHLADYVIYVTDYNHVQSTVNFQFMERLTKLGKPFYLVVNQIDKHNDQELSFAAFKEQVNNALHTWQLQPEKIFYVSLRNDQLNINEFDQLLVSLQKLLGGCVHPSEAGTQKTLSDIIEEHEGWLRERLESDLHGFNMTELPDRSLLHDIEGDLAYLKDTLLAFDQSEKAWLEATSEQIKKTIRSAILMPYETREHAKRYLESCQNNFKTGLFSSKKKIEKEQSLRLNLFHEDIVKRAQTMEWNVRDVLVKACKEIPELNESDYAEAYGLALDIKPEELTALVQSGAETTGQYVLKYADNVSDYLKKRMAKQVTAFLESLSAKVKAVFVSKKADIKGQYDHKAYQADQLKQVFDLELYYQERIAEAHLLLESDVWDPEYTEEAVLLIEKDIETDQKERQTISIKESRLLTRKTKQKEHDTNGQEAVQTHTEPDRQSHSEKQSWSDILENAADMIDKLHGFSDTALQLKRRARRMTNNAFTIALFGAFSAGKTSFANALLGDKVLPVSPNPTTAVINKIMPAEPNHPHGSVEVKVKPAKDLLNDVNYSLSFFEMKADGLDEVTSVVEKLAAKKGTPQEKLHKTFLTAVVNGLSYFNDCLGTTLEMDLSQAHDAIANEEKSCFIESVTTYYDCPFTKTGVILVDTPGADSINARHTDVAFDYIKNADAILFVTYFNHAFSRADKEFLLQLGRVKDSFAMDKMFFIVNAIDLATTTSEKQQVIDYVENNLVTFGIRKPRLYGISSLLALENQTQGKKADEDVSGMAAFMKDWTHFSVYDLLYQTAKIGFSDIQKTLNQTSRMIENMQLNEDEKKQRKDELAASFVNIKEAAASEKPDLKITAITQQIDELFYYVKKRVIQRYSDEFATFFNPALFQDKGQSFNKILSRSLNECISFLSFDIDQELRATFLRIEAFIKIQYQAHTNEINNLISGLFPEWADKEQDVIKMDSADITSHLESIDTDQMKSVFKHFKSPKQFFEKRGNALMKEDLKDHLDEPISRILEINKKTAENHYSLLYKNIHKAITDNLIEECQHDIGHQIDVLTAKDYDIKTLTAVNSELKILLENT